MKNNSTKNFIKQVLENMPSGWLSITTHRLDIYEEKLAKVQFLEYLEQLFEKEEADPVALQELPTAYDYIRLGHPLSCVLEWAIAKENGVDAQQVISFSSKTIALMAVLRKNLLDNKKTQLVYIGALPLELDLELLEQVYGYTLEVKEIASLEAVPAFEGSTVFISEQENIEQLTLHPTIDFYITLYPSLGSVLLINGEKNKDYIAAIQHVRRRETIAMTPANCHILLKKWIGEPVAMPPQNLEAHKAIVTSTIQEVTNTTGKVLVGSSGLSIQYAIMMGLIDEAMENHPGKAIKFIVPTNCYGGTNDQARRVAACSEQVEIVDLLVDREHDMVQSIEKVLNKLAQEDAVPYIIAEIPTNPRVEVPNLLELKKVLQATRQTPAGNPAVDPVFILDQTFCPNVQFLGEGAMLSTVRAVSYASGSKFPSGGKCTAGYCVGNDRMTSIMDKMEKHLQWCDNEATPLQLEILAEQLPSMKDRIQEAYKNTRKFVNFIKEILPTAKINFVSEELASQGFTPSVFSLDLPTKGANEEEKEAYKRMLNLKLINLMITRIPNDSKFCVSYGQLKGCYWTIPATSTQGTTKEGDKDYIVRAALSPNLDLELHQQVFADFVQQL